MDELGLRFLEIKNTGDRCSKNEAKRPVNALESNMENRAEGVNLDLGNACSRKALSWAKKTFSNRLGKPGAPVLGLEKAFATILDFGTVKIAVTSDGIGTKIELAERVETYETLGFDLVAMVVDDLAAIGAHPVGISNILDVDVLDDGIVDRLMKGLHDAANVAGIALTGGEIAELGDRIRGWGERMHFNWCGTGIGVLPEETRFADGSHVVSGDVILSLASRGLRSNGFTLARNILQQAYGDDWHNTSFDEQTSWGQTLLTPSRIFAPAIRRLENCGVPIHGVAHITGGGIPDNLARVLAPNRLGAALDTLCPPHAAMRRLQELGGVSESRAYRQWNMGNGMLLVIPKEQAKPALSSMDDTGYEAQVAGFVTEKPAITIRSAGCRPQLLTYVVKDGRSERKSG